MTVLMERSGLRTQWELRGPHVTSKCKWTLRKSNVSLFTTELEASTDRGLSELTTCSRKLGDPWVNHKNRNLLHPCGMKSENSFIRESQTQPGNS